MVMTNAVLLLSKTYSMFYKHYVEITFTDGGITLLVVSCIMKCYQEIKSPDSSDLYGQCSVPTVSPAVPVYTACVR